MQELDFDGFAAAWATYWGRRAIGVVVPNASAESIARSPRALRLLYDQWRDAVRAYPQNSALRLMGTPALTPDLIGAAHGPATDAPAPAAFGAYATSGSAHSEAVGDYDLPVDPQSTGARAGRALRRATWGTPLNIAALLAAWWIPVLALAAAITSLAMTIPASRLFHGRKVPVRRYWRYAASQAVAVLASVIAIVAILH